LNIDHFASVMSSVTVRAFI